MPVNIIVAGSKAEAHFYTNNYYIDGSIIIHQKFVPVAIMLNNTAFVHLVGTALMRKDIMDVIQNARTAGAILIDRTRPWMITMPSVEIAHVYSDRLGIDSEWRYKDEKSHMDEIPVFR